MAAVLGRAGLWLNEQCVQITPMQCCEEACTAELCQSYAVRKPAVLFSSQLGQAAQCACLGALLPRRKHHDQWGACAG